MLVITVINAVVVLSYVRSICISGGALKLGHAAGNAGDGQQDQLQLCWQLQSPGILKPAAGVQQLLPWFQGRSFKRALWYEVGSESLQELRVYIYMYTYSVYITKL